MSWCLRLVPQLAAATGRPERVELADGTTFLGRQPSALASEGSYTVDFGDMEGNAKAKKQPLLSRLHARFDVSSAGVKVTDES